MPNCIENSGELSTDSRYSLDCKSETDMKCKKTSQTLIVAGKPKVLLTSTAPGEIVVRPSHDAEVTVDLDLNRIEDLYWNISQKDSQVYITCHCKGKSCFKDITGEPLANILVKVPIESDLKLKTFKEKILVTGVRGNIMVESSASEIRMQGCEGNIKVKNKNGSINLENCEGSIVAKNENGSIRLENVNGKVSARNFTGFIRFSGLLSDSENHFRTSTGMIDIKLIGEPDLTFVASTSLGSIRCEPELVDARYDQGLSTCRIGDGTGKLVAKTSSGVISISRVNEKGCQK
ncbi:MAG: DUF4097 family beta strand repeat-containing protein [Candidatus Jordarchaeum sp.]|uniref:DUF4097 family beta strand repeat-containing protein n=1 Tax=Candidatus Jordarchaeum sp. TaxID=2823881 RepID=UPI0040494CC4